MQLYQLTSESDLSLFPISDIHIGAGNSRIDQVEALIDIIKQHSNAKVILLGDILSIGTKHSPGRGVFDDILDPTAQLKLAKRLLKPIRDKIVCSLTGNHEIRLSNEGFDIAEILADMLDVPYARFASVLELQVGDCNYKVFATHGHGGGTTKSGVLNAIRKLAGICPSADVYLRAHSHQLMAVPERNFATIDNKIVSNDIWYVDTGSFQDYQESYAEMINYQPTVVGSWQIIFKANTRQIQMRPALIH